VREVAQRPEFEGKNIVVIIPSFGERYVSSTLYRDLQEEYQAKQ
jgi:cysteine synthase A